MGFNREIFIGVLIIIMFCLLFFGSFSDVAPKWFGKAPNGVIMGDKYYQAPYGDFWTDYRTFL